MDTFEMYQSLGDGDSSLSGSAQACTKGWTTQTLAQNWARDSDGGVT
jgi:hypothetical protein